MVDIHEIPNPSKDEMRASIEAMKRNLPAIIEYRCLVAEITKASYDAYINQGFNEQQALELCKSPRM